LLLGDFNFHSTSREQAILTESGMRDLFLEANEESFTMPGTSEYKTAWRPDKIVASPAVRLQVIQIVGRFALPSFGKQDYLQIKEDGIVRTVSDHLGLLATCQF